MFQYNNWQTADPIILTLFHLCLSFTIMYWVHFAVKKPTLSNAPWPGPRWTFQNPLLNEPKKNFLSKLMVNDPNALNVVQVQDCRGQFSLLVGMSVCLCVCVFVPLQLIVDYAQRVRVLVFCHKIYFISIFLYKISKDIKITWLV